MAIKLVRLFALFSVFCVLPTTAGTLSLDDVKTWARNAGTDITTFFDDAAKFKKLQEGYNSFGLSVEEKNGAAIVDDMKRNLQRVLAQKIKSIKNLAKKTQALRHNYTYENPIEDPQYYNTKSEDLSSQLPLTIDEKFSTEIEINKNSSVVHIPTDVFKGGVKIRNTIKWTSGLDPYFKENDREDPTLLWQYFGSSDGVYRVYPGFEWRNPSETDVFDNRRRGWYIQGSSSPKDVVLLLDLSGSMAGQKLSILKLAAKSLLETLQENDFVNIVVMYANEGDKDNKVKPYMVCQIKKGGSIQTNKDELKDCSDHLLQATQQNKKFLKHFVPNAKARGIAAISSGFENAISILKKSREENKYTSSNCTQAIILFTDGIEDNEATKTKDTLERLNGDKKIRVFTYLVGSEKSASDSSLKQITSKYRGCFFRIKTLSDVREKVLEYVKVLSRPLGFSLGDNTPDSSWTPIYLDQLGLGLMITLVAPVFNKTEHKELLGVVGTDVALPQLEDTVPGSEVGANGYGFAINNNGFVLFHPALDKEKDPPNIALDEVEFNASSAKQLMRKMIDRLTGNMSFPNRLISEDKKRISWSEEFHYFYSPIENTSFSAAVAIPQSGLYTLDLSGVTGIDFTDAPQYLSKAKNEAVVVAPWKICPNTNVADADHIPVYGSIYPTAEDIIDDTNRENNCDRAKLKHLLFDANLTKEAAAKHWETKDGIEDIFVATHGGIMRWLNSSNITLPRYYTKKQFYRQAVQYADKADDVDKTIIVFSAPYRAHDYQSDVNESVTITASAPIIISDKNNNNKVVAAVVGMHVKEKTFTEKLFDAVGRENCNISDERYCRFIDDDGFVVASNVNDESEVGKFLGTLEGGGTVMRTFINRSQFEKLTFNSTQEECKKPEEKTSNARTLLNPLFAVTSYVQFWTQTVFWSLAQFNIYSLFSRGGVAMAEGQQQQDMIPCSQELQFYKGYWEKEGQDTVKCQVNPGCSWRLYIAPVTGTNLRLVVESRRISTCTCDGDTRLTTTPIDLLETVNNPVPAKVSYRKPPELTTPCNDSADEGKPPCALASISSPARLTIFLVLILTLFSA
ncbi:voltage-dependent calcium channel subunit alpha-2/delta-1-like isoform X2 [Porites lutea]|uniref:voltage-dependent calcium channel subunit alpha-2/delta-1-like isoform X2 n=1 Tax=Porites lutea TaxID=51062 RepID=UPI003CC6644F